MWRLPTAPGAFQRVDGHRFEGSFDADFAGAGDYTNPGGARFRVAFKANTLFYKVAEQGDAVFETKEPLEVKRGLAHPHAYRHRCRLRVIFLLMERRRNRRCRTLGPRTSHLQRVLRQHQKSLEAPIRLV